jgi:transcription-repair coupling factor (superfamily II helicase)
MDGAPKSERLIVSGLPEGLAPRVLLRRDLAGDGPLIWVLRDDRRMAAARAALAFFAPELPVMTFPAWDCLPYDRISPNPAVSAARMATLATLAHRPPGRFVLLTTLNAATQRVPMPALLHSASFAARVGERIDEAGLRRFLATMGYAPTPTVTEPGDYAIRGGIVDIFPPGAAEPLRLDLFGDVLDGVRRFDPESQRSTARLDRIELAPVSEVILDDPAITRFRQNYRHAFGAGGAQDPLYEAVSAGRKQAGMEHWLPFFHDRLGTLFDHLPGAAVALDDRLEAALTARAEMIAEQYGARVEALRSPSDFDTVYKPCPPEALYLDADAFAAALAGRRVLETHVSPRASGPGVIDAGGRAGRSFAAERAQDNRDLFAALADHIRDRQAAGPVVVASYSDGARDRLSHLLADEGVVGTAIGHARDLPETGGGLFLAVWPLDEGFAGPGLTVIAEQDVLGERLVRPARRRHRAENYLTEAQTLSPGDLVVHVDHGVGRYNGLETIEAMGAPMNAWRWNTQAVIGCSCRWRISSFSVATATRKGCSTGWAGAPGRPRRPSSRNVSARSPTSSSASPPSGSFAPPPSSSPRVTCGRRSARAFPTRKPTTSSPPSPMCWKTWNAGAPWTGWWWAMWASARPRSPCARPSWRRPRACRLR